MTIGDDLYKGPASQATRGRPDPATLIVDFSYWKPNPNAVPHGGVMGYLSRRPDKRIGRSLCEAFLARGKTVSLVGQDGGTQALRGAPGGIEDAAYYNAQADGLGAPVWSPIFLPVDFDPRDDQRATIRQYFVNASLDSARPIGAYGGLKTLRWLEEVVPHLWQTRAWSGRPTVVHPKACLLQEAGAPFYPLVGSTDDNTILRPFPRWGAPNDQEVDVLSSEDKALMEKLAKAAEAAAKGAESVAARLAAHDAATRPHVVRDKTTGHHWWMPAAFGFRTWYRSGKTLADILALSGIQVEEWDAADVVAVPLLPGSPDPGADGAR